MQLALVEMQRRVQGRVPLPRIAVDPAWARAQQAAGRPLVRFGDIPLEWSDFRLTLRQTADILLRFERASSAPTTTDCGARPRRQRARAARLPRGTTRPRRASTPERTRATGAPSDAPANMDQVLVLALRPFLARCAEALTPQVDPRAGITGTARSAGGNRTSPSSRRAPSGGCSAGAASRSGASPRSRARSAPTTIAR